MAELDNDDLVSEASEAQDNNNDITAMIAAFTAAAIGNRQAPVFDPSTDRINEFFVKFNAVMSGASDGDKISKLAVSLKNDALSWYVSELEKPAAANRTFAEWQAILSSQFAKSSTSLCNELFANKQKEKQTAVEYFHSTLRMCSAVDSTMSEEIKLAHLQRGLKKPLQEKIKLMKPKTTAEFLTDLQSLNELADEANDKDDQQKKLIEILTLQLAHEKAKAQPAEETPLLFTTSAQSSSGSQPQRNSRDYRCFVCGQRDHFANACPQNRNRFRRDRPFTPDGTRGFGNNNGRQGRGRENYRRGSNRQFDNRRQFEGRQTGRAPPLDEFPRHNPAPGNDQGRG